MQVSTMRGTKNVAAMVVMPAVTPKMVAKVVFMLFLLLILIVV